MNTNHLINLNLLRRHLTAELNQLGRTITAQGTNAELGRQFNALALSVSILNCAESTDDETFTNISDTHIEYVDMREVINCEL